MALTVLTGTTTASRGLAVPSIRSHPDHQTDYQHEHDKRPLIHHFTTKLAATPELAVTAVPLAR